jgi:RecB family exonuclease
MSRIVRTAPFPERPAFFPADATIITPHPAAALSLRVPHIRLEDLATRAVTAAGLSIALPVHARQVLKGAIRSLTTAADAAAYAGRIREILNTALRTGINLGALIEHGSPRAKLFARVAAEYVRLLKESGMIDGEALMLTAAGLSPVPAKLFVYGYFRGRAEEVEFLDRVAADGSVYYLPCEESGPLSINLEWRDRLADKGWTIDDTADAADGHCGRALAMNFTNGGAEVNGARAYAFPNIEAEVRFAIGRVKRLLLSGVSQNEAAIICGDIDSYAHTLASVAGEYGIPLRISHKVPLQETRFGGFLRLLFDTRRSGFAFESTARLLLHTFGPAVADDLWSRARKERPGGIEAWRPLFPAIGCMEWPERQAAAAWAGSLRACLAALGVRRAAAQSARDMSAFNRFFTSLDMTVRFDAGQELTADGFAALVLEILTNETTPYDTGAAGVAVHEPKTAAGADLRHLFFLGMAEGIVPADAADNPVVDFYERRSLAAHGIRFESAMDVTRWEAASFIFTLLGGRETVTLTYPATADNSEKIASSFIEKVGLKAAAAPASNVSSPQEHLKAVLRSEAAADEPPGFADARRRFDIEMIRENTPCESEFDGVIARSVDAGERKWSVSQLTAFGQCPFRWFAARVLKLVPPDEMADELDFRTRGSLYHRVLEIAMGRAIGQPDIRAATLAELDAAFAEAERDESLALPKLADWHLQRPDHLRRIRRAVESEQFIGEGAVVLAVEQRYEAEWCGLTMTGSVDRIDETRDGMAAIDYKTSTFAPKGIKDKTGKLSIDVQLPLYTHIALRNLYPDKHLGIGAYYSLTNGKVLKRAGMNEVPVLEEFAEHLKRSLADGRFPVDPDVKRDACVYCDFAAVCRKGPRLDRKDN